MHRQLAADPARLLEGEDLGEVVLRVQRPMRVVGDRGRFREAPIVVGPELREERGGGHGIVEPAQPQLLDQPVLQGAVGPFDAPFGFGLRAQSRSMLSSRSARPNCERPPIDAYSRTVQFSGLPGLLWNTRRRV